MAFSNQPLGGGQLHRPLAEINVTPLVDVMLVLLIVFMVTAPMLTAGLKVDLPQAKSAQPVDPKKPIVISVTAEGTLALGTEVMSMDGLIAAVLRVAENDTSRVVQIRADQGVNYGTIVKLVDQLGTNGMIHIALVSDTKSMKSDAVKGDSTPTTGTPTTGITTTGAAATP